MRVPTSPPSLSRILAELDQDRLLSVIHGESLSDDYKHWDKLRHHPAPSGLSHKEWWLKLKLARRAMAREIPLRDRDGRPFRFSIPPLVQELCHDIDRRATGPLWSPEQETSRDRFVVSTIHEEAITSSQMEGAATTRAVAKNMLRTGRAPRDRSERMIFNNLSAIEFVRDERGRAMTPDLLLAIHQIVTNQTIDPPEAAGRLRSSDDVRVWSNYGEELHTPPEAKTLDERIELFCQFANEEESGPFVHPVLRAVILHFWIGYDHPFNDGNGRTARAVFYWSMLRSGYRLTEFISISAIMKQSQISYGRSFLYTESDENDLNYFLIYNLKAIGMALNRFERFARAKMAESQRIEARLGQHEDLNHRQHALLSHAIRNTDAQYTVESHRRSHRIAYETARSDLRRLAQLGFFEQRKVGKKLVFHPDPKLAELLASPSDLKD